MNVLEKILEEIENHAIEFEAFGVCDDYVSVGWIKEIISSHMSEKEKVSSAEIISRDIGGKPYYEIKYKKVGEDHYTVGYSSYFLDYVIDWLNNYFEFCGEPKIVVDVGKDTNAPSKDGWIDRKNLKEEIKSLRFTITGMRNGKTMTKLALEEYRKIILKIIDEQPMYMDDGWIPVEDRLPEEHNSMFAKFKGTDMWDNAMFEKKSDEVNVAIEFEDGKRKTTTSYTLDGKWKVEKGQQVCLKGCKNRMCITDDENELSQLYNSLNLYAADLFRENLKRIRCNQN